MSFGRFIAFMATLWCLFIFFGSWYPFYLQEVDVISAIKDWLGSWKARKELTDIAVNFLLGVPTGLVFSGLILRDFNDANRKSFFNRWIQFVFWFFTILLLAASVEVGQAFFKTRNSSLIDTLLQVAGSFLGCLFHLQSTDYLGAKYLSVSSFFSRPDKRSKITLGLIVFHIGVQLWPFIPSVSPFELGVKYRHLRAGSIWVQEGNVPWSSFGGRGLVFGLVLFFCIWVCIGFILHLKTEFKLSFETIKIGGFILLFLAVVEGTKFFIEGRLPSFLLLGNCGVGYAMGLFVASLTKFVSRKEL